MNKSLFLILSFFILISLSLVKSNVGDGPCKSDETVNVVNIGTNKYLGIRRTRVILAHNQQPWCLNLESATPSRSLPSPSTSVPNLIVDFYCANSEFVLQVADSNIVSPSFDVVSSKLSDAGVAGDWNIIYDPTSQTFAIQTALPNNENLSLSAVNSDPSYGLTLSPYDPNDALQQWKFTKPDASSKDN